MHGPLILVRTLSVPDVRDQFGNTWQYHSRSDRHSKIACWGIVLDLLNECALLRKQAAAGKVCFGINHEMVDFQMDRRKYLDLVLCTPRSAPESSAPTLHTLAEQYRLQLTEEERACLRGLPVLRLAEVGSVQVALEAKACMTEHNKARPRLYDELNSSHLVIHGSSAHAIAAGFVMVNISQRFLSPGLNRFNLKENAPHVTTHAQPKAALQAIEKIRQIPRRSSAQSVGFDALGIVLVDCKNDGSPIGLVAAESAPPPGDIYEYSQMIRRIAAEYSVRFAAL